MDSLNQHILEYRKQLIKGDIQKAYRGIMSFMLGLRSDLENKYPEHVLGTIYYGYMDMTYFAFTPSGLKNKGLKIAIVYLHEKGTFEIWLAANNRKIQADYINILNKREVRQYKVSAVSPDFDAPEGLKMQIEMATMSFTKDIISLFE